MDQNEQPVFKIEKLYVKDLSLEVPNAPSIFLEPATPAVNVELATQANAVGDGFFEVTLKVTVTAKLPDDEKVVFLVEAAQGGIFQIRNIPTEELEPVLMLAAPTSCSRMRAKPSLTPSRALASSPCCWLR
jgi:preprotein translocase subunit SecB